MKRFLALILSVTAVLGVLTGCGESKSKGNMMGDIENMAEEDLPYGATMRELKDGKITICFDGRFLEDETMKKVVDYFYAVQTEDLDLFKSVSCQDYLDYVEINSGVNTIDYLKDIKANEETAVGSKFEYKYLEVTECKTKNEDTQISEIIKLMDQIYKDNSKEDTFEKTVKEAYALKVDVTSDANGSSFSNEANVYVFDCEDGIYVFN